MTDDSNARYRSSDPFSSRASGPDGHASDPLAELARLIGQTDPYAERRDLQLPPAREPQYYDDAQAQEPPYDPHHRDETYDAAAHGYDQGTHARQPAPGYEIPVDPPRFTLPGFEPERAADPAPAWQDTASAPYAPVPKAPSYQPEPSSPLGDIPREPSMFPAEPAFQVAPANNTFTAASLDAALRLPQSFDPPPAQSAMPPVSSAPSFPPPNNDEYYDDAPQGGRRRGLLTVAAVLCLAVVGTAAAFGYRTWSNGAVQKGAPPVIKASTEPSKVAAPPPAIDPKDANKITYDRFADRGQNEQVVVREEKPVDVRDAARTGPPRGAPGAPSSIPPTAQAAASAASQSGANPPSVLTEPKRVRTVPIRPDGAPDPAAIARAPVQAAAPRAAAASNAPLDLSNPSSPPAQMRAAATRQASAAPPNANAPLSLAPDANPPAAAPVRSAAPPPPAPARAAAAPAATSGGSGAYLVQVSSQRSEADAQAAFRSVKSKYSSILGDRQAVIRRADLAGKGTYYRAMVGPFASRDQAVQLCSSLKAAGGDCVVQSN